MKEKTNWPSSYKERDKIVVSVINEKKTNRRLPIRKKPEFVDFLKRSTDPRPRGRYRDALQMQNVFRRVRGGVFKKNQTKFTPGKTSMRARAA